MHRVQPSFVSPTTTRLGRVTRPERKIEFVVCWFAVELNHCTGMGIMDVRSFKEVGPNIVVDCS